MNILPRFRGSLTRRVRHRVKWFIGVRPWLFFPIFRRRSAYNGLLVDESTDICIEGYPRSANSFSVGAFEHAQSGPVQIAHHTHVPANPIRACERSIPTLVLIRDPYDAIVSHVALDKQSQLEEPSVDTPIQRLKFEEMLSAWMKFYRSLQPYRERIVVASLSMVIEDIGNVIRRVNERFGADFDVFDHTPDSVARVHAEQGWHAGPNEQRKRIKESAKQDFDDRLRVNQSLRNTLSIAKTLFDTFLDDPADVSMTTGEGVTQ